MGLGKRQQISFGESSQWEWSGVNLSMEEAIFVRYYNTSVYYNALAPLNVPILP
jgi:hypothetical protein